MEPFALSSIYVIWGRKSFTAETGHFLDTSRKVFISCRARQVVVAGQELLLFICVLHFRFHRVITCLKDCLERRDSFFVVLMRAEYCGFKARIKRLTEPFCFILKFVSIPSYPISCGRF